MFYIIRNTYIIAINNLICNLNLYIGIYEYHHFQIDAPTKPYAIILHNRNICGENALSH